VESRFDHPVEFVAEQDHNWLLIFLGLTLIWGVIRLSVNRSVMSFFLPALYPVDSDAEEYDDVLRPSYLHVLLSIILIVPSAYYLTVEVASPEWIESASAVLPEFICWVLLLILAIGTWYVLYYIVFSTLDAPEKGVLYFTSNSVIWVIPSILGVPLMLFHQYQPEVIDIELVRLILSILLVSLILWKVISHSVLIWFRLQVPAVYRFLYLCTLEILPIALLYKAVL
jgi:hypothetical protein